MAPRVLVTQDGAWRHGTIIPTKARADDALTAASGIQHTLVVRRTGLDVAWYEGDRWLHDLLAPARMPHPTAIEPAPALPAEHPLLLSSLANRHPFLRAAEVVSVADPRSGRRIVACVAATSDALAGPNLASELVATVRETLGGLARPQTVLFVDQFGTDLADDARRRALAVVAASVNEATAHVTWSQVQAAATL